MHIDKTVKNTKQEVFDGTISQLVPDNDTVHIDQDKKIINLG